MRIARRSITTGATASLAVLSFAAGVYFAVTYGSASKLEGGVAKAVETADAPTKGRSDNAPMANSVEQQTARYVPPAMRCASSARPTPKWTA